jgi:L-fucose mutarotase
MLKGIDPLLTPDLLKVLMPKWATTMPSFWPTATSRPCARKRQARAAPARNHHAAHGACRGVGLAAGHRRTASGGLHAGQRNNTDPYRSALQREVIDLLAPALRPGQSPEALERFAFYERARAAFAIVVTGEAQPFGNFILRKGVIGENLRP